MLPARAGELLADPLVADLSLNLAAGSGVGLAWAEAGQLPGYRVEALRQRCMALGGYLTVLEQPTGSALPAWEDAPARPVIEALKREFDPLQQHHQHLKQLQIQVRLVQLSTSLVIISIAPSALILE